VLKILYVAPIFHVLLMSSVVWAEPIPIQNTAGLEDATKAETTASQESASVSALMSQPLPACELHIWPADRLVAIGAKASQGFGLGGQLIDAIANTDQNNRYDAFATDMLDAKAQANILREMDLPSKLQLPPSQVIIHEQGINIKGRKPNRLSDSKASCYTEFLVRNLFYTKRFPFREQMQANVEVRSFDGQKMTFRYYDTRREFLKIELPDDGKDTGPATNTLHSYYRSVVAFFADKFARKSQR
jgi:hypothetical protein